MSAPVPLNAGCCSSPCPDNPQTAVPGPDGENAWSLTTALFVQPAVGANVNVSLDHDGWVVVGQTVFVEVGGFYQVIAVSGLTVTLNNLGTAGNAAPGVNIPSGSEVSPGGVGGNTGNAYTTTSANFVQPAIAAQVNVQVVISDWAVVGQVVYVAGGGYYTVFAVPDGTHITLTNLGYPGNAAALAVVNFPAAVGPGGLQGPTGASGVSTLNAISPTTTKGDIIVDNGANTPNASDVRLGVGSNGKAVVADSSQATGLNYSTISPNTAVSIGDIAIFSNTTGVPIAVADSKLLITSDGAIQSVPTGGNNRGSKSVDLQVQRSAATMVASGATSVLTGGRNNTASNTDAGVACGNGNLSSGLHSFIGGGLNNSATTQDAAVLAGQSNLASGQEATVCGGISSTASGTGAAIGGGNSNLASGNFSVVGGGNANTASALYSAVLAGSGGVAYLEGQIAHATNFFAAAGDAQESSLIWIVATTDATANVEMLIGGSARAVVPLNTAWAFDIILLARTSAGVCVSIHTQGAVQNNANTVSLVAANTQAVVADGTGGTITTANFAVTGDNTNKSLKLAVTGLVATNLRWCATARIVEVGY